MIQAFLVDCIKPRNKNLKYYWWRLDYRKKLINHLKKNGLKICQILSFLLFVLKDLRSDFNPTVHGDSELYLAELMKINDELKKKNSKDLRHKKIYTSAKSLCW